MKFDIPKKWFADRIEQFGEDGDCAAGNPNFEKELDDLEADAGGILAISPDLYNKMIESQKNIKIIVLSGISGSGKSTYAAKLSKEIDAEIVCPDTLRGRITGNESDMSKDGYIWNQLVPLELRKALVYHTTVIFDSTACSVKSRKSIIKTIRDINKNYQIECHYFKPDLELAKKQNLLRERKVPIEVLESQAKRWQIPSIEEGFSEIRPIVPHI